ncbi:MAG TPA: DUF2242 domain-containing protein [Pseudomonadales bacterium]|nr:DUF2242 domain-containing protein [Pseudomonadales bacterium]
MKNAAKIHLLLSVVLSLAGCSTQEVYTRESFSADSPFRLKVDEGFAIACESARRSLLGQGYLIDFANAEQVKGHKAYRVEGKANTFIEMNLVCVADAVGSTLYATGVLSTYDLKKSSNPASVGLTGVGTISLPIGQSADSLVKVAEETIGDRYFYRRFFAAVEHTLGEMRAYAPGTDAGATVTAAPAEETPLSVTTEEQDPAPSVAPAPPPVTDAAVPDVAPLSPDAQSMPAVEPDPIPGASPDVPVPSAPQPSASHDAVPVLPEAAPGAADIDPVPPPDEPAAASAPPPQ